jgi:hypothetical protein
MSIKKVSELTSGSFIGENDILYMSQNEGEELVSKQITLDDIQRSFAYSVVKQDVNVYYNDTYNIGNSSGGTFNSLYLGSGELGLGGQSGSTLYYHTDFGGTATEKDLITNTLHIAQYVGSQGQNTSGITIDHTTFGYNNTTSETLRIDDLQNTGRTIYLFEQVVPLMGDNNTILARNSDEVADFSWNTPQEVGLATTGSNTFHGDQTISGSLSISGTTEFGGDLVPRTARGATIGTLERPFRDLFLQSASINIQSDIIGGRNARISNADGNVTIQAAGFQLKSGSFVSFEISEEGLTTIQAPKQILGTESALNIIGSLSGYQQPRNFSGSLIQLTAQDNQPARISLDSYGIGTYGLIAARSARGTVDTPTQTKSGDTLLRLTAQGWTNSNSFIGSIVRVNLEAAQDFTSTASGTKITLQTTPIGSTTIQTSATIDTTGINIPTGGDFKIDGNSYTASLATTGSNNFIGNQTITGSLYLTGSGGVGFINSHRILTDLDSGSFAITGSNVFTSGQTITGSVNITGSLIVTGSLIMDGTAQTHFSHTVTNPSNYVLHQFLTSSYHGGTYAFSAHQDSNGKVTVYSNYIVAQGGGGIDAKIGGDSKLESTAGAPNPTFAVGFSGSYAQFKVTDSGTFTYRGIVQLY